MIEVIDLSVLVSPSIQVPTERMGPFKDPPVTFDRYVSDYRERGHIITRLDMGAHTGTHVDVPIHYRADGPSITDLPLTTYIGWAVIIDCYDITGPVTPEFLSPHKKRVAGRDDVVPVLRHPKDSPLTPEARSEIISWKPKIVLTGEGANPDDRFLDSKVFLEAGVPLIMTADPESTRRVRDGDLIVAVPLKLERLEGSPIRLIAIRGFASSSERQAGSGFLARLLRR